MNEEISAHVGHVGSITPSCAWVVRTNLTLAYSRLYHTLMRVGCSKRKRYITLT